MKFNTRITPLRQGVVALILTATALAHAAYPDKPIRIILAFAPGGPTDTQARWISQQITRDLGQPVIVDNRAAAGGVQGTAAVAQSAGDGHTLLFANPGPLTIAPSLKQSLPYNPRDFAPIMLLAKTYSCLAINPSLPVKEMAGFLALARQKPGSINYGSPGIGTLGHLSTELFATQAKIKLNHIPYRGAAPAVNDLLAGTIQLFVMQVGTCAPMVKDGRLRALAVTSRERQPLLPDVPTMIEAGFADWETSNWNGLLAPKGTPPAVVDRLRDVIGKALASLSGQQMLKETGYDAAQESPAAFSDFMAAETRRWADVIKTTGIKEE